MGLVLNIFLNVFWRKSKKLYQVLKIFINGAGSHKRFLVKELSYDAPDGPHVQSGGVVPFVL